MRERDIDDEKFVLTPNGKQKIKFIGFHSSATSPLPGAKNKHLFCNSWEKCKDFYFSLQASLFCAFVLLFLLPQVTSNTKGHLKDVLEIQQEVFYLYIDQEL